MRPKTPFVLAALTAFTLAPSILAQDNDYTRESLRGIPAIWVLIESLGPDAESDGLSQTQLQTDVELKLRLAGIAVLSREQSRLQPSSVPYLYLNLNTHKDDQSRIYGFAINLELKQSVRLARNNHLIPGVTTWSSDSVGTVGESNLRSVPDFVQDKVDQFINAFLSVNPEGP